MHAYLCAFYLLWCCTQICLLARFCKWWKAQKFIWGNGSCKVKFINNILSLQHEMYFIFAASLCFVIFTQKICCFVCVKAFISFTAGWCIDFIGLCIGSNGTKIKVHSSTAKKFSLKCNVLVKFCVLEYLKIGLVFKFKIEILGKTARFHLPFYISNIKWYSHKSFIYGVSNNELCSDAI